MSLRSGLARAAVLALDEARSRMALRRATHVGVGVRVFGRPHVVNHGELTIGRHVALVSSPSSIELVVAPGATLAIGDRALVESGACIRARGRVVVGAGARIGAGCIVDDDGPDPSIDSKGESAGVLPARRPIVVGENAWIDDGVVLVAGANVPAGAHVSRPDLAARPGALADGQPRADAGAGDAKNSAQAEDVDRRVRAVLARLVAGASALDARTSLAEVKGWDSLAALRVLVNLEKEFSVVLPAHLFAQHPTLEALVPAIVTNVARSKEAR